MFDFGLFLTLTVIIFSIIGIDCIGLGAYAVLGNKSLKSEIENGKDLHRTCDTLDQPHFFFILIDKIIT
jgi:hypothetical protein